MKTSMLNRLAFAALASAVSGLSSAQQTAASYTPSSRFNLQAPVTTIADQIYDLHNMMLIICTLIFIAVFGVMFYSIWKHRKSKGAVAANFHENTTVEIVWTVIPFIIIIIMALPATRTVVAMKDTTNADLTIKATGYQWKWGYDYLRGEGEGIGFLSELATPRAQIDGTRGQGPDLPARRHRAAGRAGRQEGPDHHDRQRRHPCVVGSGVRREAGRDPRLRARHLVPRREDRHVLRAVRRTVRQGPRVHADRRQGGHRAGVHRVGRRPQEADGGGSPTIRTSSGRRRN